MNVDYDKQPNVLMLLDRMASKKAQTVRCCVALVIVVVAVVAKPIFVGMFADSMSVETNRRKNDGDSHWI